MVRIYCISFLAYTGNKFIVYYYPSILKNAPAVLDNAVRVGLIGPISVFFLMKFLSISGFAYGAIIMEVATIIIVIVFITIAKRVGKYTGKGLLLLPSTSKNEAQIDLSIPAKEEEISKIIEDLQHYAFEIGKDEKAAAMLALASEEIIANTIAYGYRFKGGSRYIDVNLSRTEAGLLVRIRDDGVAFDPTNYVPGDEEEMKFHGIEVVRKVASDFKYLRLLNTNNTIMEIALAK